MQSLYIKIYRDTLSFACFYCFYRMCSHTAKEAMLFNIVNSFLNLIESTCTNVSVAFSSLDIYGGWVTFYGKVNIREEIFIRQHSLANRLHLTIINIFIFIECLIILSHHKCCIYSSLLCQVKGFNNFSFTIIGFEKFIGINKITCV